MKWLCFIVISTFLAVSSHAAADVIEISQKGRVFSPDTVDIKVGDTLKIHNDDEFLHHIYVRSMGVDSGEQPPGHDVPITFSRAGDYEVLCKIHPKMRLAVHVK